MRTTLMGLDLDGRDVLVAGGGPVAARRAARLVADGAVVTVVSPLACEDLLDLVDTAAVRWVEREVEEADVEDCWLVVAATGDRSADERLCGWAADRRVWSVCAGSASTGTARTPAVVDH
ncbi:precorrin-2 dehydrogenase/sirohydrochlorin ferrochelatase family protein, partial [Nostocoides japonicum]|uniref:precorrin-2 dehydrogenase/sirohydrochlorin ferrochelatase family protein n=1 Tax=Nostocoides japonicum TaxID=99481 RepID=UPI002E14570A